MPWLDGRERCSDSRNEVLLLLAVAIKASASLRDSSAPGGSGAVSEEPEAKCCFVLAASLWSPLALRLAKAPAELEGRGESQLGTEAPPWK